VGAAQAALEAATAAAREAAAAAEQQQEEASSQVGCGRAACPWAEARMLLAGAHSVQGGAGWCVRVCALCSMPALVAGAAMAPGAVRRQGFGARSRLPGWRW
jgi:hypothetical protein